MEGDKTIERKREEESVEQREKMQEKEERVKAKEREGKKKAERTLGQQHNYVQQKQRIPLEAPLCLFQDRLKPASLGRWKEVREGQQW